MLKWPKSDYAEAEKGRFEIENGIFTNVVFKV